MVNTQYLEELIKDSGIKKKAICRKMGWSYPTLQRKLTNEKSFYTHEVEKLCDILRIDDFRMVEKIFFYHDVDKKGTR